MGRELAKRGEDRRFCFAMERGPEGAATENRRPQPLQGHRRLSAARPPEGRGRGASGAAERSQRILPPSPALRDACKSADVFLADLFDQGCVELIGVEDAEVFIEISEAR